MTVETGAARSSVAPVSACIDRSAGRIGAATGRSLLVFRQRFVLSKKWDMTRRFPMLAVGLLILISALLAVPAVDAANQLFVSDEVEDDPASGCQADNAGSPGPALRSATDTLDDAWYAAAIADGYTSVQEASLPSTGLHANPLTISFPFAGGNRTATVTAVDVFAPAFGSGDPGTPIVGNVRISTGPTLQDCSPKPAHIFDAGGPYWTEGVGSGASRNGVRFTFDTPVRAFGAWFGDVETRPEADGGISAVVKLFDSGGSEIVAAPIDTSTADTGVCGGPNSSDLPGCGNNSTRWIGFVRDDADVAAMLVVVGDDDTATSGGDPGGRSEHVSWAGAQMALAPAALDIDKTADVAEADVGGVIEYSVAVTNTGDEPATNVTITDTPDPSLSVVVHDGGVLAGGQITWTIPTLAGGSSAVVSYSATVAAFNQCQWFSIGIRNIQRQHKLIGLIFSITGGNRLGGIGGLTTNTLRQTIIRPLNPLPTIVPIHRIEPPRHRGNFSDACLGHFCFNLFEIPLPAGRRRVPPIHKRMKIDFAKTLFPGQF